MPARGHGVNAASLISKDREGFVITRFAAILDSCRADLPVGQPLALPAGPPHTEQHDLLVAHAFRLTQPSGFRVFELN